MNHTHRYERRIVGKNGYTVMMCTLPGCNHYLNIELARGKECICNRCGNKMILDGRAIKLVKPHCVDCIQIRKKGDTHDKLLEFLSEQEK